jgi:wyosine [tRNA(Phe)-imidazoG37] synthetase (radical SAM superfamily)
LTVQDHDRDAAGLTYVYPVLSRRAGGLSVGVNLNPNNACNWSCVYCQVPDLRRGAAPAIDLDRLRTELDGFLHQLVHGDYLVAHVPPDARRLVDVALSGNGEPTTARPFDEIMATVLEVVARRAPGINKVLISNGSMLHRAEVQRGVAALGRAGGEVWFKLDAGTADRRAVINGAPSSDRRVRRNLRLSAERCRTRIQTCLVEVDGQSLARAERAAYVELLRGAIERGTGLHDVMLYGMARPSMQQAAARLARVGRPALEAFAEEIRAIGLPVQVRE